MFLAAIQWGYVASGLLVGCAVGLTGVGGGSLMTPILILIFGISPVAAVGTDLLYAAATKSVGSVVHGAHATIDWKIVRRLALGSVPAAILTLIALNALGLDSHKANKIVSEVLAIALLVTAGALIFRRQLRGLYGKRIGHLSPAATARYTVATGAVLGLLVASTSVGAGALGVTALILLYPELPAVKLVGSDIAHAVPLTLVAGAGHWYLGNVNFTLMGTLLMGSIPGILIGSYLAPRIPEWVLRSLMAFILVLVAIKLMS
ncbi:sulfite exporter TauE/SafE family protein [Rhizomicrobium palustre]|uniref:sulfite exporter TauE/SafE family protein n=1 Tax=Rhizomicrobium palustre TaxID=189966 RepID=UPI003C7BD261